MKFEQVCQPLNAYFSQHSVFRILLPLSVPLMLACVALRLIGIFIALGSLVSTLTFVGFFLFLILTVSTCDFRMAAIGMGCLAAEYLVALLQNLIKYQSLAYGSLIYMLLLGYLAFLAYRKSLILN